MTALMHAAYWGIPEAVRLLIQREAGTRDNTGRTALMIAAEKGHREVVQMLLGKEDGVQDNEGKTAMMFSMEKEMHIEALLSPFEAGIADSKGMNQTCYAIDRSADLVAAIRLEKTAGWLLDGKTILEAEIGRRQKSLFEAERRQIQRNPLWKREVQLAESQRERP